MPRRAPHDTPVHGFAAVAGAGARILILGSMPGRASLAAKEYYAHPRNQFWPIVGNLFGFDPGLAYGDRLQVLQSAGIALWDVLASCVRPTSMDADIATDSIVVNDFAGLFREQTGITQVFFNGATAAECYRRHALPTLSSLRLKYYRLPSTSPAHAGMGLQQKLAAWQTVARVLAGQGVNDAEFRIWKDGRH